MTLIRLERPKLVAVIGEIGAGKDKFKELVSEAEPTITIEQVRFSDPLKKALDAFTLPLVRKNFQQMSKSVRSGFGDEIMARAAINHARKLLCDFVFLNGPRQISDMDVLEQEEIPSVYITAPVEVRHKRRNVNPEKLDDATMTLDQFKAFEQDENDRDVPLIGDRATYTIVNDSSLEDYRTKARRVWSSILAQTY